MTASVYLSIMTHIPSPMQMKLPISLYTAFKHYTKNSSTYLSDKINTKINDDAETEQANTIIFLLMSLKNGPTNGPIKAIHFNTNKIPKRHPKQQRQQKRQRTK